MEYNKSLSARIKRRNAQGFAGVGTGLGFLVKNPGDYTNPEQNGKAADYAIEKRRKDKLSFECLDGSQYFYKSALTKKFADNHQKMRK